MTKILHIVEAFEGGVLTYLQTLINGLDDSYQCSILYASRPGMPDEPDKCFKAGTRLIHAKALSRSLNLILDIKAMKEIKRVTRDISPDVVHLHSSKAGVLGRWALDGRKTPLFYTPHGYSFLMDNCSAVKRKVYYLFEKISGYRFCTTIACGKSEYEYAKRVSKRATYISNAIITSELDALGMQLRRSNGMQVCTLARASCQKNPEMFNQIAQRLPDVHFIWIGDGELREKLTSPNIEVTGWLPKNEALRKMMDCNVFLLTSRWEGLPLSILEAMYLKRVCVVSKIPGNVDAVENDVTGYACDGLEMYVDAIRKVQQDGVTDEMLDKAQKRVVAEFSQGVMVERYKEAYREATDDVRYFSTV